MGDGIVEELNRPIMTQLDPHRDVNRACFSGGIESVVAVEVSQPHKPSLLRFDGADLVEVAAEQVGLRLG